jgi:membrane-associated protein
MFDVTHLIQTGGLLLIALIIFSETGLMLGFLLPGDTLLLSAGVLAASNKLDLIGVLITIALAATAGDNVGYHIGRKLGRRLFRKPDGIVFRKEYIDRAETFYEKYGSKTMLVAHFLPIIRAFIPVTAGAAKMPYGQFAFFDAIGNVAWTVIMTLLGYFVASRIPNIEHYVDPVLIVVVIACLAPTLWHIFRDPEIRAALIAKFKRSPEKPSEKIRTTQR